MIELLKEFKWVIDKVKFECNVDEETAINLIVTSLKENPKPLGDIVMDAKYIHENL